MFLRLAIALALGVTPGCGDDDDGAADGGDGDGDGDGDTDGDGDADSDGDGDADSDPTPGSPDDTVFELDHLHQIELEVDPADLPQLDQDRENRVPLTFRFDGEQIDDAGIRIKGGFGSAADLSGKPGFSIKFDEFEDGLEFRDLDKLLLNNMAQDWGMVNEHVGYEMFRRVDIPAPRTSYARVTLNGDLYGVYLVVEAVNNQFLHRHYDDEEEGNLYEGECCGEIEVGFTTLKNNGEEDGDTSDLQALVDVLQGASDGDLPGALDPLLDLESFRRTWALDALLNSSDTYTYYQNNFYLYHRPSDGRFVFLPHGIDQLFFDIQFNVRERPLGLLPRRLAALPAEEALYEETLLWVLDEHWDADALSGRVEHAAELIYDAVEEDPRKSQGTDTQREYAASVARWFYDRPDIVRAVLATTCGDGSTEAPEQCDDGNVRRFDGCDELCQQEICGDEVVQPGEVCDAFDCRPDCSGLASCGNGSVDDGEECDDAGTTSGDGCSRACVTELCGDDVVQAGLGEACDGGHCRTDCSAPGVCGDGAVDLGEDCDDHATVDGDGCSAHCGAGDCEPVEVAGRTWLFCDAARTWREARARCLVEEGRLAVPADAETTLALAAVAFDRVGEDWWIGPNDRATETQWLSSEGDALDYEGWSAGKPDGADDENCATLDPDSDGLWNDRGCGQEHPAVCEQ